MHVESVSKIQRAWRSIDGLAGLGYWNHFIDGPLSLVQLDAQFQGHFRKGQPLKIHTCTGVDFVLSYLGSIYVFRFLTFTSFLCVLKGDKKTGNKLGWASQFSKYIKVLAVPSQKKSGHDIYYSTACLCLLDSLDFYLQISRYYKSLQCY